MRPESHAIQGRPANEKIHAATVASATNLPIELALHRVDCLGSHGRLDHHEFLVEQFRHLEQQPAIRPPLITGRDLSDLGIKPGPAMGRMLREVREKQLEDELNTKSEALAWVRTDLGQR